MNLLFTSVGRRGYLLEYFREALNGEGVVHAVNSDPLVAAALHADRFEVVPPIRDPNYVDVLVDYCATHRISAVIPLFDLDLPVLAGARERFAAIGVRLVVSHEEVVSLANDKLLCGRFLASRGFTVPDSFVTPDEALAARVEFPVVVKPRWGMGSIGTFIAYDEAELKVFYERTRRSIDTTYLRDPATADPARSVLIQEFVAGEECTLDVVNDLDGTYVATLARRKIVSRAGEADISETLDDDAFEALGRRLSCELGHVGPLDVDVIRCGGRDSILDLNPRFGGSYPFSHIAGANVPRAIVAWLRGESPDPACFRQSAGVVGMKDLSVLAWTAGRSRARGAFEEVR